MNDPTPSTSAKSRDALIIEALSEVLAMLGVAKSSPHTRELRAQASFYDLAIKHWTAVPPTHAALDAMFDLVVELRAKVVAASR